LGVITEAFAKKIPAVSLHPSLLLLGSVPNFIWKVETNCNLILPIASNSIDRHYTVQLHLFLAIWTK